MIKPNYATDLRDALRTRPPRAASRILYLGLLLLGSALLWASMAELEEVTRGEGRVVPSRQLQVVQAPERSIVLAINAQEGQVVDQGDVLVQVEDTLFAAQLGEVEQRYSSLNARVFRLQAEATGQLPDFAAAGEQAKKQPELYRGFLAAEEQVFLARQQQLSNDLAVLQAQANQRTQERRQLIAERDKLNASISLLAREVEINSELFKRKVLPEIEFLRLQRQLSEMQGQLAITQASILRAKSGLDEASERLRSARSNFATRAREELSAAQAERAIATETLQAAQDRAKRTELRSPVHGIINHVKISTIGAVVQPGEALIELVPLEDTLLIEAQVRPQDIAFLHPGQPVTVKITAYDYSTYGGLKGTLERISADSNKDEQGNSYFKLLVRTEKNYLESETERLPIIPGMVASIDILTGKNTVLGYLLKPINKVRTEALRER
ncbi:HlyD family type I secretion periplasmic adaptor subunit [Polycladidibacter hongkongensis]|uniref:HlyD family type I secretion periplasmic adaptor subunit n=1 Tax=Polycladidibacter hongkongensis TaxID=1647556 RepID=UPI00082F6A65|nr:HlyD family type I secretion periplasmic adaptor subunit [Pseudovibrio hongkongensis]